MSQQICEPGLQIVIHENTYHEPRLYQEKTKRYVFILNSLILTGLIDNYKSSTTT